MRLHRDSNEMHVIFHEAICPYLQGIFAAVEFEPLQILKIIFISFKYCLPIVAPLGDMMRITYTATARAILGMADILRQQGSRCQEK